MIINSYFALKLSRTIDKGRQKITLEAQGNELRTSLESVKIASDNIRLSNSIAGYVRVKLFKKDVMAKTEYKIKATNSNEVKKIFEVLQQLDIELAFIANVSHSKIETYKNELRKTAIKNARNKAKDLVEAIDYKLGKYSY